MAKRALLNEQRPTAFGQRFLIGDALRGRKRYCAQQNDKAI
jgi:hypothetical protein